VRLGRRERRGSATEVGLFLSFMSLSSLSPSAIALKMSSLS
jgi:hypothetical protein